MFHSLPMKVTEINGTLRKDTISNMEHLRWREGLICLDDEPFDSLMKKFSVYYGIDIFIKITTYRNTAAPESSGKPTV